MKKLLLSIFCVFFVFVTVFLFRIFDPLDPNPHFNPRFWISGLIYLLIILYCLFFLLKNRPTKRHIIFSLLLGGITLGYGLPRDYLPQVFVCLLASIATALCFLQIISPAWHAARYFEWRQKGWKTNVILLSAITFFYLPFVFDRNTVWSFSLSGTASALAAGVSEELIFHVFFPVIILKYLKIDDSIGNRIWVYLILYIPFELLHLNYYDSLCFDIALNRVTSNLLYAGIVLFLVNKYGILYGIYAHFLCDFISLNRVMV